MIWRLMPEMTLAYKGSVFVRLKANGLFIVAYLYRDSALKELVVRGHQNTSSYCHSQRFNPNALIKVKQALHHEKEQGLS